MPLPPAQLAALWAFWSLEGIGPKRLDTLERRYTTSLPTLWDLPAASQLQEVRSWPLPPDIQRRCLDVLAIDPWPPYQAELARHGPRGRLLHQSEPCYPTRLLELADPPTFLSLYGDPARLVDATPIATVGSRRVPLHQARSATRFAQGLVDQGATLVSGGALGMDAAAHRAALPTGQAIVVMPGGHDHWTPRTNQPLFDALLGAGALFLCEYPWQVSARRHHFPRRNRLIAALADTLVLFKARRHSGSMWTVKAALRLGRPVGVVPYEWEDEGSHGGLELVREGRAHVVTTPQEVLGLRCHGTLATSVAPSPPSLPLPPPGAKPLIQVFSRAQPEPDGSLSGDEIAAAMGWGPAQMWQNLMDVEFKGWLTKIPGAHRYRVSHQSWLTTP